MKTYIIIRNLIYPCRFKQNNENDWMIYIHSQSLKDVYTWYWRTAVRVNETLVSISIIIQNRFLSANAAAVQAEWGTQNIDPMASSPNNYAMYIYIRHIVCSECCVEVSLRGEHKPIALARRIAHVPTKKSSAKCTVFFWSPPYLVTDPFTLEWGCASQRKTSLSNNAIAAAAARGPSSTSTPLWFGETSCRLFLMSAARQ